MKIVVFGDIHLKIKEPNDFYERRFFNLVQVIKKENPDILILNGDILDKANPSWYELKKFYEWLGRIRKFVKNKIVLISGNHEDLAKNECLYDYLPQTDFEYVGKGFLRITNDITLWFVSHHKIFEIYKLKNEFFTDINILFSHYRSAVNAYMTDEIDNVYVSKTFDYTILSDIHQHYKPAVNIEYTSSPYSIVFDDREDFGYIVLNVENKNYEVKWKQLNLPNLVKFTIRGEKDIDKLKLILEQNKKDVFKVVSAIKTDKLIEFIENNRDKIVRYSFININEIENEKKEVISEIKNNDKQIVITDIVKKHLIVEDEELKKEIINELELIEKDL